MARKKVCDVTGIKTSANNFYKNQSHLKAVDNIRRSTSVNNFYSNQNHVKAVDNLRRTTGASKDQLQRMFHQINNY